MIPAGARGVSGLGCSCWRPLLSLMTPATVLALLPCPPLLQLLVQVLVLFFPALELLGGQRGIIQQLLKGLQLRQLRLQRGRTRFGAVLAGAGAGEELWDPTLSVLCRARTTCTFSLMRGFLLRRMKDLRHCSCVRKHCRPMRDTPPCLRHHIRLSRSSLQGSERGDGHHDIG